MWREGSRYVLIAIAAVILLVAAGPLANLLSKWISKSDPIPSEVGRMVTITGEVRIVRDGQVQKFDEALKGPVPIVSGDRLEVSGKSTSLLVLNSKDEIELQPSTAAVLQLWNEKDPASAVYLTLLSGAGELKRSGVKGKAYVVREGRLYVPGKDQKEKPVALTVLRSAPLDLHLADENSAQPETPTDFETDTSESEPEAKASASEPGTLSNEFIDEVISSQQSNLQKCWLAKIKDQKGDKFDMVVQFEIGRRGKIKEPRVVDSSAEDLAFQRCVTSVFERITFRSFNGPEIAISYPLHFE
ncbi:MAG: AgmX/PglI C-terminal domain-containing protein [Bdellovibrionales bacterium]